MRLFCLSVFGLLTVFFSVGVNASQYDPVVSPVDVVPTVYSVRLVSNYPLMVRVTSQNAANSVSGTLFMQLLDSGGRNFTNELLYLPIFNPTNIQDKSCLFYYASPDFYTGNQSFSITIDNVSVITGWSLSQAGQGNVVYFHRYVNGYNVLALAFSNLAQDGRYIQLTIDFTITANALYASTSGDALSFPFSLGSPTVSLLRRPYYVYDSIELSQLQIDLDKQFTSINALLNRIAYDLENQTNLLDQDLKDINESIQNLTNVPDDAGSSIDSSLSSGSDQLEDKVGLLTFAGDILSAFVDLWSSPGDSQLTFPGFSIVIDGTRYSIWSDIVFDFKILEGDFAPLLTAVRFALTVCVYGALLVYLQKCYDEIILEMNFSDG